jgi:hypothetical protein
MLDETTPILLVYAGEVETSDNHLVQRYYEVTPDELAEGHVPGGAAKMHLYSPNKNIKRYMGGSVGQVYEVQYKGDKAIVPGTAKRVGRWPDTETVVRWQADHQTTRQLRKAEAARKQENAFNLVREDLRRIKRAYWSLNPSQRVLFVAQLVDELHRGDKEAVR